MSSDDPIHQRMLRLNVQIHSAHAYLQGMQAGIEALIEINSKKESVLVEKKLVGLIRDNGLKFIELGQALRRQCDLLEPILDDILKGETPT